MARFSFLKIVEKWGQTVLKKGMSVTICFSGTFSFIVGFEKKKSHKIYCQKSG